MKLFSIFNQWCLFLIIFVGQNICTASLTKAEAENGRLMNGNIGRIIAHLQRDPKGAEVLLKSAAVMIRSLEQLGQKDPESSFAKDAQKWKEALGELGFLSKGPVKKPLVEPEKIAAAKSEVDKSLEDIKKSAPLQRFKKKEQEESIAINAEKIIELAKKELTLLAHDEPQLRYRAEKIKKEYEEVIVDYKQKNQQILRKQLGFSVDVSREVALFNERIDTIVKNIIAEQRELKKKQPGGLSLEVKLEVFNEFIADQIKLGKQRSRAGTVPLTQDEKNKINIQLFEIVADLLTSLKERPYEEIVRGLDFIRIESMRMIKAQFEETVGWFGFFAKKEDIEREGLINQRLAQMFAPLLAPVELPVQKENVVEPEEAVVEQGAEEPQEVLVPLSPPKRPQLGKKPEIEKPSQPKKQEQPQVHVKPEQPALEEKQEQPQQELSKKEQFEKMKTEFEKTMEYLNTKSEQESKMEETKHGEQARDIIKFLVENPGVGDVEDTVLWAKGLYKKTIESQDNVFLREKREAGSLGESLSNFEKPIDDFVKIIKYKEEERDKE